jgi:phage baseplate assembly protein W
MSTDKSFLGTGWSFPPTFHLELKGVQMVSDEEDIKQSIEIFLGTILGERVMRPEYGNPLHQHVFEMSSQINIDWILKDVSLAIRINEPRLFIRGISANKERILDGILQINLEYEIESTNVRNNIVFPFYFAEGTSIT